MGRRGVLLDDVDELFGEALKGDDVLAAELWAALTNIEWVNKSGVHSSMTFREAAGFIADIRALGEDYMCWYCSSTPGNVSDYIAMELAKFGWEYRVPELSPDILSIPVGSGQDDGYIEVLLDALNGSKRTG